MKEKLIKMIAEYRNIPAEEIKTDEPFSKMGLDSLDMAEFVMKLEEELNISLQISKKYDTIDKFAEYIESVSR